MVSFCFCYLFSFALSKKNMNAFSFDFLLVPIIILIILVPLLILGYKKFNKYYLSSNSLTETSSLSVNKLSSEASNLSVRYKILKVYQLILGIMIIISIISLIYFLNNSSIRIPFEYVLLCILSILISIFCIVSNILIVNFLFDLDKR